MLLDKETLIKVTNRDNGSVGYTIPDLGNLYRLFEAGETKEIRMEELRKLSYIPGGQRILEAYLVLDNKDAVAELLGEVEPEYFYSEEDVKNLLLNGTLDQLKDCLDFGTAGVLDLVKKYAVELKINDLSKRKAILDALDFNVTSAIEINEAIAEDEQEEKVEDKKTRRAAAINEEKTTTRRATPVTIIK